MGELKEVANVLKLMQEMMKAQQEELKVLREQNAQRITSGTEASANRGPSVDSIEKQIRTFSYEPDEGWTFEAWWTRHGDLFDTVKLEDGEKGRMLLRHVDDTVDRLFRDHIRPKALGDLKFSEVTEIMAKLFGDKKTLFEKRLEMFNLKMSKVHIDDLREFATRVNRVVEDANVTELTPDKIKTMIFLAGVDLPRHTGAMFHIINGMKKEESPTLERILEIADSFKEAQLDAQTVTGQNRAQVNAVKHKKGRGREKHHRERSVSPSSGNDNECERCGRDHEDERCPFVSAICHNCGKVGHIKNMCRDKKKGRSPRFNKIMSEQSGNSRGEFDVSMKMNGKDVEMSVDSGSDITYISKHTWRLVGSSRARHTNVTPVCTNGSIFHVTGKFEVNLEMNGTIILREVYITEETNVLGKDCMQFFFTLMPKRPQAQLNSIRSIEGTEEVNERFHSGTGIVSRDHSIRAIEGAEMVKDPCSGNGLCNDHHDLKAVERTLDRSGGSVLLPSLTRSSLRDDSPQSEEKVIGDVASVGEELQMAFLLTSTDEDAVVNCASEDDRTILRLSLKDDSNHLEESDRSLKDDSYHSEGEILGDAEEMGRRHPMAFQLFSKKDAVLNCADQKDREILTSESERGSSLRYELKERVVTGSHSELREGDQMGAGERPLERNENGKPAYGNTNSTINVAPRRLKSSSSDATRRFAYHSSTREEPTDYESTSSDTSPSERVQEEDNTDAQSQYTVAQCQSQ